MPYAISLSGTGGDPAAIQGHFEDLVRALRAEGATAVGSLMGDINLDAESVPEGAPAADDQPVAAAQIEETDPAAEADAGTDSNSKENGS